MKITIPECPYCQQPHTLHVESGVKLRSESMPFYFCICPEYQRRVYVDSPTPQLLTYVLDRLQRARGHNPRWLAEGWRRKCEELVTLSRREREGGL